MHPSAIATAFSAYSSSHATPIMSLGTPFGDAPSNNIPASAGQVKRISQTPKIAIRQMTKQEVNSILARRDSSASPLGDRPRRSSATQSDMTMGTSQNNGWYANAASKSKRSALSHARVKPHPGQETPVTNRTTHPMSVRPRIAAPPAMTAAISTNRLQIPTTLRRDNPRSYWQARRALYAAPSALEFLTMICMAMNGPIPHSSAPTNIHSRTVVPFSWNMRP